MRKADIMLINGKIYSVNKDNSIMRGEAIAIYDGVIQAIGRNEEIKEYSGERTRIIDCDGCTILPGLCDDHCHASFSANFLTACDLFNVLLEKGENCVDAIKKYKERIRHFVEANHDDKIIRGIGWNLAYFNGSNGESRMPTRHDLDDICSDKPIVLESYCQHNIWVNTKALELSGMDASVPTPVAGNITREGDGYPEGVFQEMSAIKLIKQNLPGYDYTIEEYKDAIRYYQKELANIYGITLINDALHTDNAREAYKQLAAAGELTIRVRGVYDLDNACAEERFREILARKGMDEIGDLFGINTVKIFMEGAFCMCEPYQSDILKTLGLPEGHKGETLWSENDAKKYMTLAMREGFQIHIHAMGDQAIMKSINSLEYAQKQVGKESRNIIAHLMALRAIDIKRIGKLGIICSCQPRWMVYDTDVEDFYTPYFGQERALGFYPNKQFLDAGCVVAYGTDFPVTPPPNPYHELQCAITRSVFKGAPDYERFKGKILGSEDEKTKDCVALKDGIKSLCLNGAYQNYLEDITGSIEVGKSAELVLTNCDIEAISSEEIYNIKVKKTIFKGKVVYEV